MAQIKSLLVSWQAASVPTVEDLVNPFSEI